MGGGHVSVCIVTHSSATRYSALLCTRWLTTAPKTFAVAQILECELEGTAAQEIGCARSTSAQHAERSFKSADAIGECDQAEVVAIQPVFLRL